MLVSAQAVATLGMCQGEISENRPRPVHFSPQAPATMGLWSIAMTDASSLARCLPLGDGQPRERCVLHTARLYGQSRRPSTSSAPASAMPSTSATCLASRARQCSSTPGTADSPAFGLGSTSGSLWPTSSEHSIADGGQRRSVARARYSSGSRPGSGTVTARPGVNRLGYATTSWSAPAAVASSVSASASQTSTSASVGSASPAADPSASSTRRMPPARLRCC